MITQALNTTHGRNFDNCKSQSINSQQSGNNRSRQSSLQCQSCNKIGHSAAKCWHRTNLNYVPAQTNQAFPAAASNSDWFLDSGASTHFTNDITHLSNLSPLCGVAASYCWEWTTASTVLNETTASYSSFRNSSCSTTVS